jgi:hypothetical protein
VNSLQQKIFYAVTLALAVVSFASAQNEAAPPPLTWQEKIAKGLVPYHQLTVEDFKIDRALSSL